LVDEGCKEVRSVSHNMMPNALVKAGLASYEEFVTKLMLVLLKQIFSEGLDNKLEKNVETVLYRIIQECKQCN
jgi:signal transduction histidine kinase